MKNPAYRINSPYTFINFPWKIQPTGLFHPTSLFGTLEYIKKGFLPAKETPPNILRGGHRYPYQMENAIKCMYWDTFFHVSLGSCVGENSVYATWRPDLVRWVDKIGIFFVSIWGFLTSRLINLTLGLISGNNLVSSVTKGMFNFSNSINSIMDWIPLKTVFTKN